MIIVSVLYPKTGQSHFDFDYYLAKHIPMVKDRFERFGLKDVRLMRGAATLDGGTPMFELIGELIFPSRQLVQDALGTHGDEIIRDIPMFTNVQPTIQINEML
ncbi:MAG TPA: EthD family reductase [Bryobacteraceae bacterium]|nr:EthD family reductase [Bryobacteraceae bacterium]